MEKHSTKRKGFFLTVGQGMVGLIILCGGLLLADIPSFAASFNFSNTTPIVVPGSGTMGPASFYPSTIFVSGLLGTVTNVNECEPDVLCRSCIGACQLQRHFIWHLPPNGPR